MIILYNRRRLNNWTEDYDECLCSSNIVQGKCTFLLGWVGRLQPVSIIKTTKAGKLCFNICVNISMKEKCMSREQDNIFSELTFADEENVIIQL